MFHVEQSTMRLNNNVSRGTKYDDVKIIMFHVERINS